MPLNINVTTGVQDGSPATVLFEQEFLADASADFDNPSGWSHAATAYDATSLYTGAASAGVMYFGSPTDIESETITIPASGLDLEVYWIMQGRDFSGTGDENNYSQNRVYYQWLDDLGADLEPESDNIAYRNGEVANYGEFSVVLRRPAEAAFIRIKFERRSAPTELGIFYLQVHDVLTSGVTPVLGTELPYQFSIATTAGYDTTMDFSDAFDPEVDGLEVIDLPANYTATIDGPILTLNPATGVDIPLVGGAGLEDTIDIRGKNGDRESFAPTRLYTYAQPATPLSLRADIPTFYLEAGHFQVFDPVHFAEGGAWPMTAVVNTKPSWMEVGPAGLSAGFAVGSGAQTTFSATVTDAIGQTVIVNLPISIISVDRSSPQSVSIADATTSGSILAEITDATDAPTVVQLEDGEYPSFGNSYRAQYTSDEPLVIMGPATILGNTLLNQAEGIWFENVTFKPSGMPDLTGDSDDRRAARSLKTASNKKRSNGETQAFLRFTDCRFEGLLTDLSHETGWNIRDMGDGTYEYDDTATVGSDPTTGRYSQTCYNGGLALDHWAIAQDCHSENSVMALSFGTMAGASNWTANRTRVDQIRVGPTYGAVLWGITVGSADAAEPILNRLADEHGDLFQSVADASKAVGGRIWMRDGFLNDKGDPGIQALQWNMGTSGSYNEEDPPTLWPYDVRIEDFLMVCSIDNGLNMPAGELELINTVIIPDPLLFDPVTSAAGVGGVRGFQSVHVEATNCIFPYLTVENKGPRNPWVFTNCIAELNTEALTTPTIAVDIFPNLYSVAAIEGDPRIGGSSARFWRDDTEATQGPSWLSDT